MLKRFVCKLIRSRIAKMDKSRKKKLSQFNSNDIHKIIVDDIEKLWFRVLLIKWKWKFPCLSWTGLFRIRKRHRKFANWRFTALTYFFLHFCEHKISCKNEIEEFYDWIKCRWSFQCINPVPHSREWMQNKKCHFHESHTHMIHLQKSPFSQTREFH